jgi:hypothetical protein
MTARILNVFVVILFLISNSLSYGMNYRVVDQPISFADIGTPQIGRNLPAARLVKHASKGAITACGKSYVLNENYAAKALGGTCRCKMHYL